MSQIWGIFRPGNNFKCCTSSLHLFFISERNSVLRFSLFIFENVRYVLCIIPSPCNFLSLSVICILRRIWSPLSLSFRAFSSFHPSFELSFIRYFRECLCCSNNLKFSRNLSFSVLEFFVICSK